MVLFKSLACVFLVAAAAPTKPTKEIARGKPTSGPAKARPSAKPKKQSRPGPLVQAIQRFYEGMTDFEADFIQIYSRVALSKTTESRGTLKLKKPGKMRWDYQKPIQKLFVSDGKKLWVYEPEEAQVIISPDFQASRFNKSLKFLWGDGRLQDTFDTSNKPPKTLKMKKGHQALTLVPKQDATYRQLVLVYDPKLRVVVESILYETTGNTNHFKFRNIKLNKSMDDTHFNFTPPPGTDVTHQ